RSFRVDGRRDLQGRRKVQSEDFLRDDARAVESVIEPEIGGQWMMSCASNDEVFEEVAGLQAEDAEGFYAAVQIVGSGDYCEIGVVGDGAGEKVRNTAARVGDAHHWNFYCLEAAVE